MARTLSRLAFKISAGMTPHHHARLEVPQFRPNGTSRFHRHPATTVDIRPCQTPPTLSLLPGEAEEYPVGSMTRGEEGSDHGYTDRTSPRPRRPIHP